jgi:hypothetical protein
MNRKTNREEIRPENVFTIGTAKVLSISQVNSVIRYALYRANGNKHKKTYAFYYHNGSQWDKDRHFHVAFTRELTRYEKQSITECVEHHCKVGNWGRVEYVAKWGVGFTDKETEKSNTVHYLGEHKHCIGKSVRR